jgi:hypothetical protein
VRYTPGPWEVENLTKAAHESWFNIFESHGFVVAEAIRDRATARLIAAAPELLAALKDLHADCVEYARINNLHNSDGSPATHHSMRRAAAIIRKAESPLSDTLDREGRKG